MILRYFNNLWYDAKRKSQRKSLFYFELFLSLWRPFLLILLGKLRKVHTESSKMLWMVVWVVELQTSESLCFDLQFFCGKQVVSSVSSYKPRKPRKLSGTLVALALRLCRLLSSSVVWFVCSRHRSLAAVTSGKISRPRCSALASQYVWAQKSVVGRRTKVVR